MSTRPVVLFVLAALVLLVAACNTGPAEERSAAREICAVAASRVAGAIGGVTGVPESCSPDLVTWYEDSGRFEVFVPVTGRGHTFCTVWLDRDLRLVRASRIDCIP